MPTIDELAPATAAADTDELPANQNGITRKLTRAQLVSGLQTQLTIPANTLLGRSSVGYGAPETIAIGSYLTLAAGTLSAQAAPYSIALSPSGVIPSAADQVAIAQNGSNTAVSYSVFLQGLHTIGNIDGSQLLVTPANGGSAVSLATMASSVVETSGGSLSGPLFLAGLPTQPLHAVTKQYVDANPGPDGVVNVRLPPCGARLDGVTDDTAAFISAYQLAPTNGTIYVPNGTTVLQPLTSWRISTAKPVKWMVDGTVLSTGQALGDPISGGTAVSSLYLPGLTTGLVGNGLSTSQGASQASDFTVSHVSYVVNHNGGATQSTISATRADTVITSSPQNNVWAGVDRLVWNGPQTQSSTTPSRHIGRYVSAIRQTVGTNSSGSPLPQPMMWAGYFQMLDTSGSPSSWTNASTVIEADWTGNGVDDANQRTIQALTLGQSNLAGAPVEISSALTVSLASGSTGKAYRVLNVSVPFSVSALDTTSATQLTGAAAIRMAAGHAIAFEPGNSVNLAYSASSGAIFAHYGSASCVIGRGLSLSYAVVVTGNWTLSAASVGSMVLAVGAGSYTITLPLAATLPSGTGFTFSVLGTGSVSISVSGSDTLDLSPVTLRQYDRYHIISDGSGTWREVFRANAVAPHFQGSPVLPSYTVAGLPSTSTAGSIAFASNGRKPSESTGGGTGVQVFFDGSHWISTCSGTVVVA